MSSLDQYVIGCCTWLKTSYYTLVVQSKANMEYVGVLPVPEEVLPTTIIPLFGILLQPDNTKQAECHFCFEKIEEKELLTRKTPCCGQSAHCGCFRVWAAVSVNTIVRCAYCRATFPDEDLCFLCLKENKNHEKLVTTNCCQTNVHQHCIEDLRRVLLPLSFQFTLECGQPTWCGCIWTNI